MLSQNPIVLLPSKDGRIFELRRNGIGEFTVPAESVREFDKIEQGFKMSLPKIRMKRKQGSMPWRDGLTEPFPK